MFYRLLISLLLTVYVRECHTSTLSTNERILERLLDDNDREVLPLAISFLGDRFVMFVSSLHIYNASLNESIERNSPETISEQCRNSGPKIPLRIKLNPDNLYDVRYHAGIMKHLCQGQESETKCEKTNKKIVLFTASPEEGPHQNLIGIENDPDAENRCIELFTLPELSAYEACIKLSNSEEYPNFVSHDPNLMANSPSLFWMISDNNSSGHFMKQLDSQLRVVFKKSEWPFYKDEQSDFGFMLNTKQLLLFNSKTKHFQLNTVNHDFSEQLMESTYDMADGDLMQIQATDDEISIGCLMTIHFEHFSLTKNYNRNLVLDRKDTDQENMFPNKKIALVDQILLLCLIFICNFCTCVCFLCCIIQYVYLAPQIGLEPVQLVYHKVNVKDYSFHDGKNLTSDKSCKTTTTDTTTITHIPYGTQNNFYRPLPAPVQQNTVQFPTQQVSPIWPLMLSNKSCKYVQRHPGSVPVQCTVRPDNGTVFQCPKAIKSLSNKYTLKNEFFIPKAVSMPRRIITTSPIISTGISEGIVKSYDSSDHSTKNLRKTSMKKNIEQLKEFVSKRSEKKSQSNKSLRFTVVDGSQINDPDMPKATIIQLNDKGKAIT